MLKVRIRIVAKCFKQVETKDLYETFRLLLIVDYKNSSKIISQNKNELRQLDKKTSYLKANLDESIIMTQPGGFEQFKNQKIFSLHSEENSL